MTKRRGKLKRAPAGTLILILFHMLCMINILFLKNDLFHGWGLDFAVRNSVEAAHEKIGVVDTQWIVHQGKAGKRNAPKVGVRNCMTFHVHFFHSILERMLSSPRQSRTQFVNSLDV
ncbi:hypothetical protein HPP92_020250 [Vanilla planifolia]|uniref:Uncharacterized protein n=1 Tax=Vanilla planifolia TaxID=51239 RepID=A0A835Q0X4_VANPL|nr:hypothetical protein HPP92_020250 [Vanilla planifolia]